MPTIAQYFDSTQAPDLGTTALRKMLVPAEYAGDPTNNVTPEFEGQFCKDTSGKHLYWASAATSADWKKLNN